MTSRNIIVTWREIDCIERNGIITGYTVVFQEQGGADVPGNSVDRTFSAGGLTPGRKYTFQVAAVNDAGTGPFTGSIAIFTTEDGLLLYRYICSCIFPMYMYMQFLVLCLSSLHIEH